MGTVAARRDDPAVVVFLIGPETRQRPDEAAETRSSAFIQEGGKRRNSLSSSWPRSYRGTISRLVRTSARL